MPSLHRHIGLIALAGICSVSVAQLVTPPPATNPAIDANIPKAPPPPPVSVPPPAPPPVRAKPVREEIPNLPWKEWDKDDKGVVKPIDEPLDLAALRRNPYVSPEMMSKIEAYLPERRASMQRIIIENLDLVEKIDDVFERVNLGAGNRESVGEVVRVTKPLQTTSLAVDLKNRGIIDEKAMGFNARITTAYNKAVVPPVKEDATKEEKSKRTQDALRTVYKSALNEHQWTYVDLLNKAVKDVPGAAPGATRAETAKNVEKALAAMPLEQRKDLLRKVAGLPKAEPKAEAKPDAKADAKPAEAPKK